MSIVVEIQIQDGKVIITVGGAGRTTPAGLGQVVDQHNLAEAAPAGEKGGAPPIDHGIGPGGGGISAGGVTVIGPIVICSNSSTTAGNAGGAGGAGGAPPPDHGIGPGGGTPAPASGAGAVLVIGPIVIDGGATPAPPPPGKVINEANL